MPRRRAWADTVLGFTLASGTQSNQDLLADLPAAATVTVARILVHLWVLPDVEEGLANGIQALDVGIGVSSSEAFVAGVVPDPQTQADVPARGWLWADRIPMLHGNATGPPAVDRMVAPEVKADLGAMRKVDRGVLYMSMTNTAIQGTAAGLFIIGRVRALCLT